MWGTTSYLLELFSLFWGDGEDPWGAEGRNKPFNTPFFAVTSAPGFYFLASSLGGSRKILFLQLLSENNPGALPRNKESLSLLAPPGVDVRLFLPTCPVSARLLWKQQGSLQAVSGPGAHKA